MANRPVVRALLAQRGINIPEDCRFVGAQHDTCSDAVTWYDLETIPKTLLAPFERIRHQLHQAQELSAHERCRRFFSAEDPLTPRQAFQHVTQRAADTRWSWTPAGVPVEFVSLTGKLGVQLRATVASFGPLLLAKVLGLNDTQTSVLTLVFKYCDDMELPLLDLGDLRAVLQYLTSDKGKDELATLGGMSPASVGVLLRKMVELEMQGAEQFFGEPEFDVQDLLHVTREGRGVVTCLELSDVQDKPQLYSTFLMWLLAELYHTLPEAGDLERPKLVFFFDEAHLLFSDASKAFLQ